jgi:DNA replication and repair protein RecF
VPDSPAFSRLILSGFRNYASLRLAVHGRVVVLTGPNGAGKTNLLEAVSLFAPGRGLRGADFAELVQHGAPAGWSIAAELDIGGVPLDLQTAWTPTEANGGGRESRINGAPLRGSGGFGEHVRLIWLTPAMDRLFSGPAGDRRRFFDRLAAVHDPAHAARVLSFEKAMRERNLLLEKGGADDAWLSAIEKQMAEYGAAIAAGRLAAIAGLQEHVAAATEGGPFPWSTLTIDGEIESELEEMPAVQVEDRFRAVLRDSRAADARAGRALKGPHRSDFKVTHGPKAMAAEACSTGEQKALLIGLILAQAREVMKSADTMPILLMDEIAAHLDRLRRRGLFRALLDLGSQVWLTGTENSLFEELAGAAEFFHVEAGIVTGLG